MVDLPDEDAGRWKAEKADAASRWREIKNTRTRKAHDEKKVTIAHREEMLLSTRLIVGRESLE